MNEYEYWHLGITISLNMIFIIIFIVMHSHVWTREGYAGLNLKLEDHEVDKFVAHVISEVSLISFILISMLEPLIMKYTGFRYTAETKIILGAAFAGSGIWAIFGNRMKKMVKDKDSKPEK